MSVTEVHEYMNSDEGTVVMQQQNKHKKELTYLYEMKYFMLDMR